MACHGDEKAARRLGVNVRSIERWRAGAVVSRQTTKQVLDAAAELELLDVEARLGGRAELVYAVRFKIETELRAQLQRQADDDETDEDEEDQDDEDPGAGVLRDEGPASLPGTLGVSVPEGGSKGPSLAGNSWTPDPGGTVPSGEGPALPPVRPPFFSSQEQGSPRPDVASEPAPMAPSVHVEPVLPALPASPDPGETEKGRLEEQRERQADILRRDGLLIDHDTPAPSSALGPIGRARELRWR